MAFHLTCPERSVKEIEDLNILNMLVQMNTDQVQAMYTVKESKGIEQLIVDFNDKMICVDMGQTMKDHYRNWCKHSGQFSEDFFGHANIKFRLEMEI